VCCFVLFAVLFSFGFAVYYVVVGCGLCSVYVCCAMSALHCSLADRTVDALYCAIYCFPCCCAAYGVDRVLCFVLCTASWLYTLFPVVVLRMELTVCCVMCCALHSG
jgi:hypothetical protein